VTQIKQVHILFSSSVTSKKLYNTCLTNVNNMLTNYTPTKCIIFSLFILIPLHMFQHLQGHLQGASEGWNICRGIRIKKWKYSAFSWCIVCDLLKKCTVKII
jgi:hypothetical protein